MGHHTPVLTGIDRLPNHPAAQRLATGRVAILAHHASVNSQLRHLVSIVRDDLGANVVRLFGPEHGLWSTHQDMEAVDDSLDPVFHLPTLSLYGDHPDTLAPPQDSLNDIDIVVADLMDIGARYYTYAATIVAMARACAAQDIPLIVLDRPNPIDGVQVEGSILQDEYRSFVGAIPVPHRHGRTMGELVKIGIQDAGVSVDCEIIETVGWDRSQMFPATGLPWVPPSPNMPTFETAVVYPGLCLLEATTLSEGRGTTTPFLVFGAPGIEPVELAAALSDQGLAGVSFRPHVFRPMFQKYAGELCGGVQLSVDDPQVIHGLELGVRILEVLIQRFRDSFGWRTEAYEFVTDRPAIDLLAGDPELRERLEAGTTLSPLFERWSQGASDFAREHES
ncbi:MAG: hypothetical protein CMH54_13630 [Myxococcales bacterium]|nr:hypothetical protein [Myxococcales bacterium]